MISLDLLTLADYMVDPYKGVRWDSDYEVGGGLRDGDDDGGDDGGDGVGPLGVVGNEAGPLGATRCEAGPSGTMRYEVGPSGDAGGGRIPYMLAQRLRVVSRALVAIATEGRGDAPVGQAVGKVVPEEEEVLVVEGGPENKVVVYVEDLAIPRCEILPFPLIF